MQATASRARNRGDFDIAFVRGVQRVDEKKPAHEGAGWVQGFRYSRKRQGRLRGCLRADTRQRSGFTFAEHAGLLLQHAVVLLHHVVKYTGRAGPRQRFHSSRIAARRAGVHAKYSRLTLRHCEAINARQRCSLSRNWHSRRARSSSTGRVGGGWNCPTKSG
ncbi:MULTISPECIES: hypothetical protein [unclassified Paraburkholderia]|uniref:hypothetical protein n=1 Tax=unclassified Paraburkholderia TaxID=2615204 RepID=UPI002AB11209|nr:MULTISPECIES: hypothetical protein [unclassified Paraburkholderia]